jgi:hypothetical protein
MLPAADCNGHVTVETGPRSLYPSELAENIAPSSTPELSATRDLGGFRARIRLPYRSGFNRAIRLLGMVTLLGSSLGLLAAVAGFPLNWISMLVALLLSLVLIGISIRPSLRRPKF